MRGRKPKPIALQVAEGDPRKVGRHKLERLMEAEPSPRMGLPPCPEHLSGLARSTWTFWAQELEAMELDRRPDAQMLEGACVNYARAVVADEIISREGLIIERTTKTSQVSQSSAGEAGTGAKGTTKRLGSQVRLAPHPAIAISRAAWVLVRAFCSEFGLSPASRTRLVSDQAAIGRQESDLMELLLRRRAVAPKAEVVQ